MIYGWWQLMMMFWMKAFYKTMNYNTIKNTAEYSKFTYIG